MLASSLLNTTLNMSLLVHYTSFVKERHGQKSVALYISLE